MYYLIPHYYLTPFIVSFWGITIELMVIDVWFQEGYLP
jgi:hypothetical protein